MKLVLFSGNHPDIGLAELETISNPTPVSKRLAIVNTNKSLSQLAYTRRVYQLLFTSTKNNLEKDITRFNWNSVYKKDFAVSIKKLEKTDLKPDQLSDLIWCRLKSPKANLSNPTTRIEFIVTKTKIYCGIIIHENKEPFSKRKAHNRPKLSPTSLHPRLARAMVNLTGATKTILDPFCGTGGFLIEAALIGLKPTGFDIDPETTNKCRSNLKHYNIKANVKTKDALTINRKYNYIVTDLPYGLSSKKVEYNKFFKQLKRICNRKAAIGLPTKVNHKKLTKGLNITHNLTYYLHKSLSKRILVVKFK